MLKMTKHKWSLPYALAVTLIALATICQRQAISISDQQQQQVSISGGGSGTSESQASAASLAAQAPAQQISHGTTTPTTTATTEATSVGRSTKQRPNSSVHNQQAAAAAPPATAKQSGRARKTAVVRQHQQQQQESSVTTTPAATAAIEPASTPAADDGQLAARLVREYSNTPPVFLTHTRDLIVDVALFSLGSKVTTMQAFDQEGDRLEYSLKPASYRDASPYFAINATSGELRLANRRIPAPPPPADAADAVAGSRQDAKDGAGEDEFESGTSDNTEVQPAETPGYLYYLNVAANDGTFTSVVELQIHVFNSSALGTNSPVQLTIEGGRRGSETIMHAKTSEFFNRLYGASSSRSSSGRAREKPTDNSTIVIPSFVNPALIMPDNNDLDQLGAQLPLSSSSSPRTPTAGNKFNERSEIESTMSKFNANTAPAAIGTQSRTAHELSDNRLALIDRHGSSEQVHTDMQHQQHALIMQQPVVMSLIMIVASCLVIVFVLLVFIVPLSVKRLKRRLKNMEMQHEQLSQKTSSNTGGGCSSAGSSSGGSTLATGSRAHLPSLSQFTLASGASGSMMHSHHDHHMHLHHHQTQHHQRMALGRQVSLDSALTSSGEYGGGDCGSHLPQNYNYQTHQTHSPFFAPATTNIHNNGQLLNRINNGAIVNPIYMQQAQLAGLAAPHHHAMTEANIYCPIDDEHYTTINTELPGQVSSLVGQTSDSRAYFGSGCAALPSSFSRGRTQQLVRDTHSPADSQSSRSSTRSLARFLSLPARHLAHQTKSTNSKPTNDAQEAGAQSPLEVSNKRKTTTGSFLAELEYHFRASDDSDSPRLPAPPTQHAAQTIARANRISQGQQVRHKRQRCAAESALSDEWEIERHRLTFLEILGEGQFGQVWRCKLRLTGGGQGAPHTPLAASQTVAVKTLKKCAAKGPRERDELLAEIEVMKLVCDHPNVVRILHCCTGRSEPTPLTGGGGGGGAPILLVMEHVELGKLQAFLEKSRASHQYASQRGATTTTRRTPDWYVQREGGAASSLDYLPSGTTTSAYGDATSPSPPTANLLTSRELVKFMYHIAKGMEYVSSQAIVHRDLASRNILLSGQRVCKIGDFGMARHMASVGDVYERHSRNTKVPVRWMAPEVLLENSFTTKSDVFSFGILMWEIVTLGSTPYVHLKTEQIIEAVARRGERPERPEYCHTPLYSIMSACWQEEATRRPSFSELVKQLDALLMSGEEYIELDQYSDHNYYNIDKTMAPLELL